MTASLEIWILAGSLVVMALAAIANQVIHEISWHDLEDYCKLRRRPQVFSRIIDLRDEMALGTLMLQMLATALVVSAVVYLLLDDRAPTEIKGASLVSITAVAAFLLLVLNSWIPWAISRTYGEVFLFHTWRIWWLVAWFAWPLMVGARFMSALALRAGGRVEEEEDDESAFEDEILSMVSEGERDGVLHPKHADMIEGIMELDDYDVGKIMTPRSRMDALDVSTDWEKAVQFIVESGRTRIPVYREDLGNIVGILYAKDVLRESLRPPNKRRTLDKLKREPLKVPISMRLDEMLKEFLEKRVHMAIVLDEYERVAGVVTIEDVLEEIVGEIFDETDTDTEMDQIQRLSNDEAIVTGTTHINRLNEALGLQLPEDADYDTVAGLIMARLKEIPKPGREAVIDGAKFIVEQANRRNIRQVRVKVLHSDDDASNEEALSGQA